MNTNPLWPEDLPKRSEEQQIMADFFNDPETLESFLYDSLGNLHMFEQQLLANGTKPHDHVYANGLSTVRDAQAMIEHAIANNRRQEARIEELVSALKGREQ